ncbi:DUF6262 family protein [Streptomyces pristinaespiralis]|uniref:DUF6262 family protein n=1 Tax=Streptomyces pristinaespiralis TaxID=38300 RepID=UPI00384CD56C
MSTSRTDAAVRARRQAAQEMLQRLQTALAAMARDHTPVTVAALARTARVSRTFLYQNQQARALVEQATRTSRPQPGISNSRSRTQPAGGSAPSTPKRHSPRPSAKSALSAPVSQNSSARSATSNTISPKAHFSGSSPRTPV